MLDLFYNLALATLGAFGALVVTGFGAFLILLFWSHSPTLKAELVKEKVSEKLWGAIVSAIAVSSALVWFLYIFVGRYTP